MKHTISFFQSLPNTEKFSFIGLIVSILSLLISFLGYAFPLSPAPEPTAFCPALLSQTDIKNWTQVGKIDKASISNYIDEFNRIRGASGGFYEGDVLPRDVYIITAFGDQGDSAVSLLY